AADAERRILATAVSAIAEAVRVKHVRIGECLGVAMTLMDAQAHEPPSRDANAVVFDISFRHPIEVLALLHAQRLGDEERCERRLSVIRLGSILIAAQTRGPLRMVR